MKVFAALLGFGLTTAALVGCEDHPRETKDRLTPSAIRQMVDQPIAAVREQNLASGEARFRQLLTAAEGRYGPNSVQTADLLIAFGVELYSEGFRADNEALSWASLDYLREAIRRYRTAFGPEHPEVAVALHSFADADISMHSGRLTPEAKAALEEALRIRRAALGRENPETQATQKRLARAMSKTQSGPFGSAESALDEAEDAVAD